MTSRRFIREPGYRLGRRQVLAGAAGLASTMAFAPRGWAVERSDIDNASGAVKMLVWEGYDNPDAFAALGGIQIEAGYLAANEDTITKTQPAGAFDMLTIYQGMVDPLMALDRVEPIDTSLLNNYGQLYPFFRDSEAFQRDGKVYAVPYAWGSMEVLYDADNTSAPASFDDLMSPDLTGKIAMVDDAYASITTFARYAGFDNANHLTREQLDQTMELLRKFKPQLLSIAPSYGELPAMFSRREILVSVPDWVPTALAARDSGVNVQATIPQEGGLSFVDSWMMVAGAENEAGAYAVLDQGLSAEAQAVIGENTWLGIVNPDGVALMSSTMASAYRYDEIDQVFDKAPLYSGVPVESDEYTTLDEWLAAWTDFKAA
jgi:putative spermidine/putrescine transport system substrate-binding protein/spermidine/putrescine transport system substrate-binding protein